MRHLIKSKRGMTLIEVLAVTIITSIVAILVFSIIQSSVKQQVQQSKETADLNDITYALKVVTKDIRRSENAIPIPPSRLDLVFPNSASDISATYLYLPETNQFIKKTKRVVDVEETEEIILNGIGCVEFSGTDVISIKLSNTSVCSEGQSTEIHLR